MTVKVIVMSDWHIGGDIDYDEVMKHYMRELHEYDMPGFTVVYTGDDKEGEK